MDLFFRAEGLSVGYHGKELIKEMTFGIKKGEILTLIGPNGAGKTTVLKSIAGQLAPLGGVLFMDAQDLAGFSRNQLARSMAVVLTDPLHSELMTCEEVVEMGRFPYTGRLGVLSEADHLVVYEAMELVGVSGLRDREFAKLSDGQRQRVLLAKGLCQEPALLLLDEPTSYLDVKYKLEFLSILQRLCRKKGITAIVSLHELDLAERISDRILCIKGDRVERFGAPEEIFVPGYIKELFSITAGSFDEVSGSMELQKPMGEPQVFVIARGGCMRSVYRRLQRADVSFATGILYENDLDYPVACALSGCVISARAFEPVGETHIMQAKKILCSCKKVICVSEPFAPLEQYNAALLDYARTCEKDIELWQR